MENIMGFAVEHQTVLTVLGSIGFLLIMAVWVHVKDLESVHTHDDSADKD